MQSEKIRSIAVICISFAVLFISALIYSCFDMGLFRFFLRKAQHKGGKIKDLFCYFSPSESFKLMLFVLRYSAMKFTVLCLSYLPFVLSALFLLKLLKTSSSLSVTIIMGLTVLILFICGAAFMSAVNDSLFLVKFYFANGCFLNFRQLVSSSQNEMKKQRKALVSLKFSFVWWFLSCIFVVPFAFVFLYYRQSKAVLAAEIMKE